MRQAPLLFVSPEAQSWTPPAPPDLSRFDTVDLDCETDGVSWQSGHRPVGLAVGAGGQTWYLPFAHKGGGNLCEATVRRWADRELRGKRIRNLKTKFDLHMFRVWGVDLTEEVTGNTFHDVSHSAALLDDHRRSFSLENLAQAELGAGKLDVGPKDSIADLPAGAVAPYAMRDVELVDQLAAIYTPQIRAQGLERVAALEDAVIPAVVEMERNGLPVDLDLLHRWDLESRRIAEALQWELQRLTGFVINPDAPTDMTRLFQHCHEPLQFTPAGRVSFTAPVVKAAAQRHRAIEIAYRIGKVNDLRSKSIVKYLKDQVNGVLYPSFHQLMTDQAGANSGRFSSARPNAQNVTAKDKHYREYQFLREYGTEDFYIRRAFLPGRGSWFGADQAQVELRLAAHYSHAPRLLRAYAADPETDFHKEVIEMIRPLRPHITRTESKTCAFLKLYGGGVGRLADQLGIDHAAAEDLSQQYDMAFPEFRNLLSRAIHTAETRGYVKTILGRRARFPRVNGRIERSYSAANRIIQGSAADIFKTTLVALHHERKALGLTIRVVVHDEVGGDIADPSRLPEVLDFLNVQRVATSVPVLWAGSVGPSWAACK